MLASAAAAPKDPWVRIQSANFELFTTGGESEGRSLLLHFEQVRAFFQQAFGREFTNQKPVRVIAFRNDKEYAPYRPSEAASAFYHPGQDHDFIILSHISTEQSQVATHEYTHLLIHQTGAELPVWLNEGLAELYSTFQQVGTRTVIGTPPAGRVRVLMEERWIPLPMLLAATRDSALYNEKARAGIYYAESWALTHMLNLDQHYRPHLKEMVGALGDEDAAAAFQKAYGKPVEQVQKDLEAYVRSPYLNALALELQLPKAGDAPRVEAGAALGAQLALAELLSGYPARQAQARTAYEGLATAYPNRWEVESGWARFLFRERRNAEALRHFSRAAELGAVDPRTFVDYARALSIAGKLGEAVDALHTALKLDGGDQEAHFDLGLAFVRSGEWQKAVEELSRALPVTRPQASRFFYNMGYAEYRLGDLIAARAYVEQGRQYIKIPEETAALERLSQSIGPPVVEGTLEAVECEGKSGKLRVRVGERAKTFLTPDLTGMQGLECGSRPGAKVRIEYQALPPGSKVADAVVRTLLVE